jgi:hypothetical protein
VARTISRDGQHRLTSPRALAAAAVMLLTTSAHAADIVVYNQDTVVVAGEMKLDDGTAFQSKATCCRVITAWC